MINPNALPQSATVQDFQNFGDDLNSTDYNDTLNAMRYMQAQQQPTGGLNRLPQVTVPMQEGGMMEEAMMQEEQMPEQAPMNPEEAMLMEQVEQQDPRQPNPEAMAMAQEVASYGRGGDKLILHVRPDELQGLSSMLTITINPETGMPEAFLKGLRRAVSRVTKSKAFKTLAPIALAIAAPYAGAYMGFGVPTAASGLSLKAKVAAMNPYFFGGSTGVGSLVGNILAGKSFSDSAKAAAITGGTAGVLRGVSNKMAGKTFMGGTPEGTASMDYQTIQSEPLKQQIQQDALAQKNVFTGNQYVPVDAKTAVDSTALSKLDTAASDKILSDFQAKIADSQTSDLAKQFAIKDSPNLFERGIAKAGEALPESVKKIGSAIGQDFNPFTKQGAMNLLTKGATADLGASVVESQNMADKINQQAENELENMGYTITGYGTQKVITDPSGVTLPATLTAQQILDRAVGGGSFQFAPKTTYVETKEGGLINLAAGGEFSGMVPGQGGGMDDNVYMPIKEGREQVGTLAVSPTEYVVDSYTMAALGDGNPEEGAKVMDKTIKQIREKAFGNTKQPNEIDGLAALKPMVQGV